MKVIISGKRIATAVLTLVLIFGVAVLPAKAATTKVKNQDFTLTKSKIKKPTEVKAGIKYKLKFGSMGKGYVKFKAPKKKEYTFNFSKYKVSEGSYVAGYANVLVEQKYANNTLERTKVKTQGGKAYNININTKESADSGGDLKTRYIPSRYAKIKLKKGQTVYVYICLKPNATLNFNVK